MKKYYSFDKNLNLKPDSAKKIKNEPKLNNILLAKYANIGYYLLAPLLIGVFLGLYLDSRLGTHYLVVIGIVIGAVSTVYNLFRLLKQ